MTPNSVTTLRRVLLVDDDPAFIDEIQSAIGSQVDFRVVSEAADAKELNGSWRPDLIVLDPLLGSGDPFILLDQLRKARRGEQYGLICLVKGRGAHTYYRHLGEELFGMIEREWDQESLKSEIDRVLRLTAGQDSHAA